MKIHVQPYPRDPLACDHDGTKRKLSGKWHAPTQARFPLFVHACKLCGKCPACFLECTSKTVTPVPFGMRKDIYRKRADTL